MFSMIFDSLQSLPKEELEFGAWSLVSRLEFGPNAHGAWSLTPGVNLTLGEDIGRGADRSRMRALCICS